MKVASETKPGSSKKVTNAAKAKHMRETDGSAQFQGLERVRDAMGDSPLLDDQSVQGGADRTRIWSLRSRRRNPSSSENASCP